MQFKKDTIQSFKVVTGEEVIAKIVGIEGKQIYVSKPLVLVPQMVNDPATGQPRMSVGLANWFNSNPDDTYVEVNVDHLVALCNPTAAMHKNYEQSTTTIALS